jgi:hypothetical protein
VLVRSGGVRAARIRTQGGQKGSAWPASARQAMAPCVSAARLGLGRAQGALDHGRGKHRGIGSQPLECGRLRSCGRAWDSPAPLLCFYEREKRRGKVGDDEWGPPVGVRREEEQGARRDVRSWPVAGPSWRVRLTACTCAWQAAELGQLQHGPSAAASEASGPGRWLAWANKGFPFIPYYFSISISI